MPQCCTGSDRCHRVSRSEGARTQLSLVVRPAHGAAPLPIPIADQHAMPDPHAVIGRRAYVHCRAHQVACDRRSVSRVAIVTMSRKARPTR
jgi:hypothetical protein